MYILVSVKTMRMESIPRATYECYLTSLNILWKSGGKAADLPASRHILRLSFQFSLSRSTGTEVMGVYTVYSPPTPLCIAFCISLH